MKRANTYKGKLGWQSEFSHRYACWANNHNGWAKAKKSNKRLAKRRLKDELRKELVYSISDKQVAIQYFTAQKKAASGWLQPEVV